MPRTIQHVDRELIFNVVENIDSAALYQPESGYSGRGMDGERCLGIILESTADLAALGAELVAMALEAHDMNEGTVDPYTDSEDVRRMIRRARTDSLGRCIIVYFPGWQIEGVE